MGVSVIPDLDDWFDIGLFTADPDEIKGNDGVLYFERHRLTNGDNTIRIIVDQRPSHGGVDPYVKRINRFSNDNVIRI